MDRQKRSIDATASRAGHYAMDVINTKNPDIIEAYIWIAILTLLVSRRIYSIVRSLNAGKKMVRYTQLRWSTIFS